MEPFLIWNTLRRRRRIAAAIFFLIVFPIVAGTILITPSYDSTARVLLKKTPTTASILKALGLSETLDTNTALSDTDRANYLALAALRPVAEKTISDLNLRRIRTRARLMNAVPGLRGVLRSLGIETEAVEQVIPAEEFLNPSVFSRIFPHPRISIEQYEETDIILITGISPIPKQAMDIANTMAGNFISEECKRVEAEYSEARKFIDRHIDRARKAYVEALRAVVAAKEEESISDPDAEIARMIEKLVDLKKSVEDNRLSLVQSKASIRNMEAQLRSLPGYLKYSEQMKENDMILSLKQTLRDLYLSLAESRTSYTKEHPSVIEMENKIIETKKLLQEESVKVFGTETVSVNPVYQDLAQKLAAAAADLAGYEAQGAVLPDAVKRFEKELGHLTQKSARISGLQPALTETQDIFSSLLRHRLQVGMAEAAALSQIHLVEAGIEPEIDSSRHRKPSFLLNTMIAVFLGMIFAVGGALLFDYLKDTICSSEDLRLFGPLAMLGSIPEFPQKNSFSGGRPYSPFQPDESIRRVRLLLDRIFGDQGSRSITVTSIREGEGKTFFASHMAVSCAGAGQRVLLVDGNLFKPGLETLFDLPRQAGWTNYLADEAELSSIPIPTRFSGLFVLPVGDRLTMDLTNRRESEKLNRLIQEMRQVYDWVIVDGPSLETSVDAVVFHDVAEQSLLVVRTDWIRKSRFQEALEEWERHRLRLLGVVLNRNREIVG